MIHNIFSIPIGEYDFNDHPQILLLLKEIKQYSSKFSLKHDLVKKGKSSFDNSFNILNLTSLSDLKYDIQKCISNYCDNIRSNTPYISHSWFNIMKSGGKTGFHSHEGSVVSGALYPLLEKDSCNLKFYYPMEVLYNNFIPKSTEYKYPGSITAPIKQNYLYLFPSWLEHETEVNIGNTRIVVSFNTSYNAF